MFPQNHKQTCETREKIGQTFHGKTWKLINGKRVWLSKEIE